MQSVFVVQRAITKTFYSVRSENVVSKDKPCIVAFTQENDAKQLRRMLLDMQDKGRPHQPIHVRQIASELLLKNCSIGNVDVLLFRDEAVSVHIAVPPADKATFTQALDDILSGNPIL